MCCPDSTIPPFVHRDFALLNGKRLEAGTFELPGVAKGQASVAMSWSALLRMIEGVELAPVQKRKRYSLEKVA